MNRVNKKQSALPKASTQKKVTKKSLKKTPVKKTAKRTFRTTTAAQSHLYAHHEEFAPTKKVDLDQLLAPPQEQDAELLEKDLLKYNATQYAIRSFDYSTDVDRRTTFTIFKPCKNSMQNAKNDNWSWRIREDRGRGDLTNQLAGDDYFGHDQGIYPVFPTQEAAIEYCKANNFQFAIQEEPLRRYDMRSYADNFTWKGPPKVDDV